MHWVVTCLAIIDVIKYEGDNSTFVWKHPREDFNTSSQLIVHETQEAVFFLNGQPMDLFGSGKYTLETENIPLLRHVINIPTAGASLPRTTTVPLPSITIRQLEKRSGSSKNGNNIFFIVLEIKGYPHDGLTPSVGGNKRGYKNYRLLETRGGGKGAVEVEGI